MLDRRVVGGRRLAGVVLAAGALLLVPGVALAHGGGLASARPERLAVPTWLFLLTGGGVVGASFLLSSLVTDRAFVARLHGWHRRLGVTVDGVAGLGSVVGLAGLLLVVVAGFLGPTEPLRNAAILVVWAGWWAGYTASVYLVGNSWRAVNPVRTLADAVVRVVGASRIVGASRVVGAGRVVGGGRVAYPDSLGSWPAVAGLLALVWVEVVSPLAADPRLLAGLVAGYVAVGVAGAVLLGRESWFGRVDPVSNVFRLYGRVAPLQGVREADNNRRLRLTYPGGALGEEPLGDSSEVALVVALVWVTTFDGLVRTPAWRGFAVGAVEAGVPAQVLYPVALLAGFLTFLVVFRLAVGRVRTSAPTFLTTGSLARLFAPALLAIAAGYHLAHFLGSFLALLPALVGSLVHPLGGFEPVVLSLPAWFGGLSVAFVLVGHLLAIWVAHGVAYDRFPGRLQAIRSQFAVTAVMVAYTMLSLWIVTQPAVEPPFV